MPPRGVPLEPLATTVVHLPSGKCPATGARPEPERNPTVKKLARRRVRHTKPKMCLACIRRDSGVWTGFYHAPHTN